MRLFLVSLFFFTTCLTSSSAYAQKTEGLRFSHHDWEIVCDNTRTCRAAGYNAEDGDPVSVLLTRKAGAQQAVSAELMLGDYEGDFSQRFKKLPARVNVLMQVNDKALGAVSVDTQSLMGTLSAAQVDALVSSLSRKSKLVWKFGKSQWQVSDKGAAAVLLKMDEFQGRLGTHAALIKKGTLSEEQVLPALPMPIVHVADVVPALPSDANFLQRNEKTLRAHLISLSKKDDSCPRLEEKGAEAEEAEGLSVTRLNANKMLVSTLCWRAAYNEGYGYWVINQQAPFQAKLVTIAGEGTAEAENEIIVTQKGRGLGDCMWNETWLWNGQEFIQTSAISSGMCKLIAPGGAWELPLIVTDVKKTKTVKSK